MALYSLSFSTSFIFSFRELGVAWEIAINLFLIIQFLFIETQMCTKTSQTLFLKDHIFNFDKCMHERHLEKTIHLTFHCQGNVNMHQGIGLVSCFGYQVFYYSFIFMFLKILYLQLLIRSQPHFSVLMECFVSCRTVKKNSIETQVLQ